MSRLINAILVNTVTITGDENITENVDINKVVEYNEILYLSPPNILSGGNTVVNNYNTYVTVISGTTSGGDGIDGGIFITDIQPTLSGTVANKVLKDDTVLLSCDSDTRNITTYFYAFTGHTNYEPTVFVNGISASNLVLDSYGRWVGSVVITASQTSDSLYQISATHEDGGHSSCNMTLLSAPEILNLAFTGYPTDQTSVKLNDILTLSISADKQFDSIEVYDYQACKASITNITASTSYTLQVSGATRGTGLYTTQTAKIRIKDISGIWSDVFYVTDFNTADGVGTFTLDNDAPVISTIAQANISYPSTQLALKNTEIATVNHTITYPNSTGTVVYSSPNSELSITNSSVYEPVKVVSRENGTYNIINTNLRIVATKTSNKATATRDAIIYIANSACTLTVTEPTSRLRSGGNNGTVAQNHVITITSSQRLLAAPTLSAPVGTWQGIGFSGTTTIWTRSLQIHDDDAKGVHAWGEISGTNLAGIPITTIAGDGNYTVGGFVIRTLTVAAWTNRETLIGTSVVDTSKLRCSNLSKGISGSLNFTFKTSIVNEVDKYTITNPSGVYNATGTIWYNCDQSNAVSNTLGTMTVELEEIV